MSEGDEDDQGIERVTVIAEGFTSAAMDYHRRKLGEQGYSIEGPIGRHKFYVIEGPGEPVELFDGEPRFAATFVRKKPD